MSILSVLKANGGFKFGNCLYFETNDYIKRTGVSLWRNQTRWEMSTWVNLLTTGGTQVLFNWGPDVNNRINAFISHDVGTGKFKVGWGVYNGGAAYIVSSSTYSYGVKQFLHLQFDGDLLAANRLRMSINGVEPAVVLAGVPPTKTQNTADATAYYGTNISLAAFMKGKMAHNGIRYNRTWLTIANCLSLYSLGNGASYQPYGYDTILELNEGAGTTCDDDGADNQDFSFPGAPNDPTWTTF